MSNFSNNHFQVVPKRGTPEFYADGSASGAFISEVLTSAAKILNLSSLDVGTMEKNRKLLPEGWPSYNTLISIRANGVIPRCVAERAKAVGLNPHHSIIVERSNAGRRKNGVDPLHALHATFATETGQHIAARLKTLGTCYTDYTRPKFWPDLQALKRWAKTGIIPNYRKQRLGL